MSTEHAADHGGGKKTLWWAAVGAFAVLCLVFAVLWPMGTDGIKQGMINLSVGAAVIDAQRNALIALGIGIAALVGLVFGVIGLVLAGNEKKEAPAAGGHH